ncbi:MAG: penicillin-binding protein 1A [Gammaproteobacteria bacterium]
MNRYLRILFYLVLTGVGAGFIGVLAIFGAYLYLAPGLPDSEALKDVQLQVPLRVYSRDGRLITEFGDQKRVPLIFEDIPEAMVWAFLAAEDDRYFEHPGVDYQGLLRAVVNLVLTGEKSQGGSTITMQVARNYFLTAEKTYVRKLREIFLALKIERELNKEEILTLYFNKIYMGKRAYGIGAAAEVYYGLKVTDLDLAQIAMIAGMPKAPSTNNPITNPKRALERRNYVLGRMLELGYITNETFLQADAQLISASYHGLVQELEASYVGEMVRTEMVKRYGDRAYTAGFRVITTIDSRLQKGANRSLHNALMDYDRRYGYRGPIKNVELNDSEVTLDFDSILAGIGRFGNLVPVVITRVDEQSVIATMGDGEQLTVGWAGLNWARISSDGIKLGPPPQAADDVVSEGDVAYVELRNDGWWLAQIPVVQGSLVVVDPRDGAIAALDGGFDFLASKFNRAVQAERQPGSSFKPFIYSAAMNSTFTPATVVNDAPVVFEDALLGDVWRPENDSGRFYGPTRLREALVNSRNLVSIRVLREIGVPYAIDYLQKFGFESSTLPHDLSLALGSVSVTPLQLASAYAVIGNGGFQVESYFIDRIENIRGDVLVQSDPTVVCQDCVTEIGVEHAEYEQLPQAEMQHADDPVAPRFAQRVMDAQTNWLIVNMMQDVIKRGTGRRALVLGRNDLAGKTGTTNEYRDAWFSGFNNDLVTTAWVGFDEFRSLGPGEYGGRAALPMWIEFMGAALRNTEDTVREQPSGLVTVRISPLSGLLATADDPGAIFETFKEGLLPEKAIEPDTAFEFSTGDDEENSDEELF